MIYDRERNPHNATRTSTRVSVKETQETLNASSGQENITRGGDSHGARTEGTGEEERKEGEARGEGAGGGGVGAVKGNGGRDNIKDPFFGMEGNNIGKEEEKG